MTVEVLCCAMCLWIIISTVSTHLILFGPDATKYHFWDKHKLRNHHWSENLSKSQKRRAEHRHIWKYMKPVVRQMVNNVRLVVSGMCFLKDTSASPSLSLLGCHCEDSCSSRHLPADREGEKIHLEQHNELTLHHPENYRLGWDRSVIHMNTNTVSQTQGRFYKV